MPLGRPLPGVGRRDFLSWSLVSGAAASFGLATGCGGAASATPSPSARPPDVARTTPNPPTLRLPARPSAAPTGSEFLDSTRMIRAWERERVALDEILSGNIPEFLRELAPITLADHGHQGVAYVARDYLAIGTNADYVRIPMTIRTAKKICKATKTILPTPHLVDLVYSQADARVTSPTEPPGTEMGTNPYIESHNRAIEARMRSEHVSVGELVAGEKKDVVITRRMLETPGRTPIYGWMRPNGDVIQPLSLVHDDKHVDYAHGIRLVSREVTVDGVTMDLLDVLARRDLAGLLSDEGKFDLRIPWDRF